MIKKWFRILLLSFVLMYSSCEVVGAMTCMEPMKVPGYEYLSINYDPFGNVLVYVDKDADGKADFAQLFQLVQFEDTGEIAYIPFGDPLSIEKAKELQDKADGYNKSMGFKGKCFDLDTKMIRNESDRWV